MSKRVPKSGETVMMAGNRKTSNAARRTRGERPTIGFLTTTIDNWTSQPMWLGANAAAKERDANLISFLGRAVRSPVGFYAQSNVLYDLVSAERLDGLLCWTSSVGRYIEHDEVAELLRHYGLPAVGLTLPLKGVPTVVIDGYRGMRDAIDHLLAVHGYRRLALIGGLEGHPYAEERYRAYMDALAEYDVPLNPALVVPPGGWGHSVGVEGVAWLIDQHGLHPGDDFEAIVAVSDGPALGALEALQERGVQVPGDVALVGFNDSPAGRAVTPPLTSVAAPLYEQGWRAIETLLMLLEGEEVADQVSLPAQLVIRQSCGCRSPAVMQAAARPQLAGLPGDQAGNLETTWPERRGEILAAVGQTVEPSGKAAEWVEQLADAFFTALTSEEEPQEIFLSVLERVLRRTLAAGDDVSVWQGAISALRCYLLPYLVGEKLLQAEDLGQQARVMIGEAQARGQADQQLRAEQQTQTLRVISHLLITTFDVEGLADVLAEGLPQLGIPGAFLSLYEDPANHAQQSWLILAYGDDGRVELEAGGPRFPSPQLVPQGMWPQKQYSYVVESLYFQENQIGFALFEVGPQDGSIYGVLRGGISGALQGALLLRARAEAESALEKAYAEVEQQVQERTAELKREQQESARLQQEVIEAQQRALQELSTPIIPILELPQGGSVIVVPLIGSIDTMRARDLTRSLLAGIREHGARVVILDITGVPVVDSEVAAYLNKTVQAARLKGARTIVTGISEAVAETVVDLGIDWSGIETLRDLRTGLKVALGLLRAL